MRVGRKDGRPSTGGGVNFDARRFATLAEYVASKCGLPRLAEKMAATPDGGPTAEAAMSYARYGLDRVAKVNNSIRMDKRTVRKTFAHYICNGGDVIIARILGRSSSSQSSNIISLFL